MGVKNGVKNFGRKIIRKTIFHPQKFFFHRVFLGGVLGVNSRDTFFHLVPRPSPTPLAALGFPNAPQGTPWDSWCSPWLPRASSSSRCSPGHPAGLPRLAGAALGFLLPRAPLRKIQDPGAPRHPDLPTVARLLGRRGGRGYP